MQSEIDFDTDRIEAEACQAFADGKNSTDCPYPEGSSEWNCWLSAYDQFKHAPFIKAGKQAARRGLTITTCPTNVEQSLQDAWKLGWMIVHDGPFAGFNDLKFEFQIANNDGHPKVIIE